MRQSYKEQPGGYGYTIKDFGGINEGVSIGENEFSSMMNMSSSQYPLAAIRDKRLTVMEYPKGEEVVGFYCKEGIVTVTRKMGACHLYINNSEVDGVTLSAQDNMCPKNIVGMGAYIVIFPDKVYLNMLDHTDKGSIENVYRRVIASLDTKSWISFVPCTIDGEQFQNFKASAEEPESPENGDTWCDTSKETSVYKVWDEATKQWQQMSATYIRIGATGIGKGFSQWDGVKFDALITMSLAGLTVPTVVECDIDDNFEITEKGDIADYTISGRDYTTLKNILNQSNIIYNLDEDYIVVAGILGGTYALYASQEFKVSRSCPVPEIVVEHNNRLWGCRYGKLEDGKVVNEIYACRQGDFKNWSAYLGVSTDSYAVSVGTDGPFTGAAVFCGYPVFFKEDCIHKIYGSIPSEYQVVTTQCRGVKKGQNKSLVTVNNALFYCSPVDYCAYDGALPVGISDRLLRRKYKKVIGGGLGDKVYFYGEKQDGTSELLTFDTIRGLWHRQDAPQIEFFSRDGHILYYVSKEEGLYKINSVNTDCDVSFNINGKQYPIIEDKEIEWFVESGDIGLSDIKYKYLKKIIVRARLTDGASFRVFLQADDEEMIQAGSKAEWEGVKSMTVPVVPMRAGCIRYRIEGKGQAEIISVHLEFDEGSDRP